MDELQEKDLESARKVCGARLTVGQGRKLYKRRKCGWREIKTPRF